MSFVSIVAREEFITVVSDGLVTNLETGDEVEQRYKKFARISENQFVAFAGNQGLGEAIKETLPNNRTPYELLTISNQIRDRLLKEIPVDLAKMFVAIGGINGDGNVELHTFTNIPTEDLTSYYPKGDEVAYIYMASGNNDLTDSAIDNEYKRYLGQFGYNTPNRCIRAQKALNTFISQHDSTVNRITFDLQIRK